MPTPLVLIQRDHIPRRVHAWLIDDGSLSTGKFARAFYEVLTLLLHLYLQLIEGGRLDFSLRMAFGMRQPFPLLLSKDPIWSFHSGEHSRANMI